MAPPLSSDLHLSHELHHIFDRASEQAEHLRVPLSSIHLLVALCQHPNDATQFLEQQHLRLNQVLALANPQAQEPKRIFSSLTDRAKRLSKSCGFEEIHCLHLLAAVLREPGSLAYKLLERAGINLGGVRTAVMTHAPAALCPARSIHDFSLPTPTQSTQTTQAISKNLQQVNILPARQQIRLHPGLRSDNESSTTTTGQRRTLRLRNRTKREEPSNPIHPALRDAWLRATPAQGLPCIKRTKVEAMKHGTTEHITTEHITQELPKLYAGRTRKRGEHIHTTPQPASMHAVEDVNITQDSTQTQSDPPPMSLKARFAERKKELMNRSCYRTTAPTSITPPPPAVQAAAARQRARQRIPTNTPSTPKPPPAPMTSPRREHDPVEEASSAQSKALHDAKNTTRSLAMRLFKSTPDEPIQKEQQEQEKTPLETSSSTALKSATSAKPRRPDPNLANQYRLDPDQYPLLSKLGRNITEEAAMARIDPVIGRDAETIALIDILGKRRGNNPLLVGDPGVGKTAIVEGLAHHFCTMAKRGDRLGERIIIELEIGRLMSGTQLRGSFAERLIGLKEEVLAGDGKIIVFLDEIHSWMNAGSGGDGSDAAGELKTALARGQFPCIGATTNDEFSKFIEGDPAFERRFQIVEVEEPDLDTAIIIARGVREHYERHHCITYADSAIDSAVRLSHRYIHERRLPDKAINVLDMAGSRAARQGKMHVGRADIAHVVAEMASLPPERLTRTDRARFLDIERHLANSVIGHKHVIRAVSEVLRRNYAGFRSKRPIGSMLFLGPTGVGKTELVKALADFLFHDRDAIVRLDMSEFMEAHSASRFIGAPPGYVGYEQGGQLTEAIRRRPYQVVLLDEIEKAHPDILNLLLQLFDEGRLTDGRGRTVDFSNTIVIMTSNLGAQAFNDDFEEDAKARIGFSGSSMANNRERQQNLTEQVFTAARSHFPPELWNRIDEQLVFMPLRREEVAKIASLQLKESAKRLFEESGITLKFDPNIIDYLIANGGYDRKFGARPMRQTIQRLVEGDLARIILSGQLKRKDEVMITLCEGRLSFTPLPDPAP